MTVNIHQFYRNPATNIEHYLPFYKKKMKEIWEENTKTQARNLKVRKELATFLCSSGENVIRPMDLDLLGPKQVDWNKT